MTGHNQSAAAQNTLFSWRGPQGIGVIGVIGQLYCNVSATQPPYGPYDPYAFGTPPSKKSVSRYRALRVVVKCSR
jgi:hypothetical protein